MSIVQAVGGVPARTCSWATAASRLAKTLYMVGTVDGVTGFYLSTDLGGHWTKINSEQQNWGWIPQIVGVRRAARMHVPG